MTKYKYYIFEEANNALVRFKEGKPYDAEIYLMDIGKKETF